MFPARLQQTFCVAAGGRDLFRDFRRGDAAQVRRGDALDAGEKAALLRREQRRPNMLAGLELSFEKGARA